jgi:tripeptidyl-peptidase-1
MGINNQRVRTSLGMNWLSFNATISEAERLFKAKYYMFEHMQTGTPHVACHEYHLPAHVAKLVDFVTPSVHFDAKVRLNDFRRRTRPLPSLSKRNPINIDDISKDNAKTGKSDAANVGAQQGVGPKQGAMLADNEVLDSQQLENCDQQITLNCLRALYGFGPATSAQKNNLLGIVEYAPQSYVPGDLDKFFANFSSKMVGQRPILASIDGGQLLQNRSFSFNGEADLDLQIAMPLINPIKTQLYQVGEPIQGASFNNFLDAIDGSYCTFEGGDDPSQDAVYPDPPDGYIGPANCGGFQATKVISTSFGYNEADLTEKYVRRQCAEYMKLALQGVTVLYSSGDFGVAGNLGQCIDPATGNFTGPNSQNGVFNPSFPSACPWVTSVGATQVANGTNIVRALASGTQPERACETVIQSGGGFSNVFEMPQYQASTVHKYFANSPPPYSDMLFNNSMRTRGFPDVSANGANYVIAVDGSFTLVYGTSASAPAFGSIITLLNEQRMKNGKSSVGFLNQVLYEHPE